MWVNRRHFLTATTGIFLTGCAKFPGGEQTSESVSFETLVRQVKYDIGSYLLAHQNDDEVVAAGPIPKDDPSDKTVNKNIKVRQATSKEKCLGQVSFAIQKVKLTVLTEVENKIGGSGGLVVPVGISSVNLSGLGSFQRKGSLTTALEIYPLSTPISGNLKPVPEFQGRPINDTLEALRTDLVRTADVEPCFDFGQSDSPSNTVKWGFTVTKSVTSGGKFGIAIFSIGAEGSSTTIAANTIEVTFIGTGGFG